MGCEVLCSDVLFIADVDVPELGGEGDAGGGDTASDGVGGASVGGGFLTRLWRVISGGPEPTPMTTSPQDPRPQDRPA